MYRKDLKKSVKGSIQIEWMMVSHFSLIIANTAAAKSLNLCCSMEFTQYDSTNMDNLTDLLNNGRIIVRNHFYNYFF